MNAPDPSPAVLYAAKSTADPRGSIPGQLADCRALAEREGLSVVAEFTEESESGYTQDRGPALRAAMDRAEREAPAALIVQHSDRLARGDAIQARHLIEIVLWAFKADVTIRSVQDDLFNDPRTALLTGAMMGQRNTEDSARKSSAVKSAAERRARAGKHHGRIPFGYQKSDGGALAINEGEAATVRRIYADYVAGKSQRSIVRGLNRDGIRPPLSREWTQPQVAAILRNPFYRGAIQFNGEEYPGRHDPIIDAAVWAEAERRRQRTTRTPNGGPIAGRPPKGLHLFTRGILRCGHCGGAMTPHNAAKRTPDRYMCTGRLNHGTEYCPQTPIRRDKIDPAALAYFEAVALDVDATEREARDATARSATENAAALAEAEREERAAAEAIERVRRDYTAGEITAAEWRGLRSGLESEAEAARANLAQVRSAAEAVAGVPEAVASATAERLRKLREAVAGKLDSAADLAAVRSTLLDLFERFEVVRADVLRANRDAASERAREAMADVLDSIGEDSELIDAGAWIIAPFPRAEAFDWGEAVPALTRRPLPADRERLAFTR